MNENPHPLLHTQLYEARVKKFGRISDKEFAEIADISIPMLARIESGKSTVTLTLINRYAKAVGVSLYCG